jgi:hypothetical protein
MFEVHDLKYATPATVSRCGMVWFSEDVLKTEMIFENFMTKLQKIPLEEGDEDFRQGQSSAGEDFVSPTLKVFDQRSIFRTIFSRGISFQNSAKSFFPWNIMFRNNYGHYFEQNYQCNGEQKSSRKLQYFIYLMSKVFTKSKHWLQIQRDIATILSPFFVSDGLVKRCLEYAATLEHIMDFTR